MFRNTRIEVLNVMAHFILTILILAGYVMLRFKGIDDETMKLIVVAAATYFFGSTGQAMLSSTLKGRRSDTPPDPQQTSNSNGNSNSNNNTNDPTGRA